MAINHNTWLFKLEIYLQCTYVCILYVQSWGLGLKIFFLVISSNCQLYDIFFLFIVGTYVFI